MVHNDRDDIEKAAAHGRSSVATEDLEITFSGERRFVEKVAIKCVEKPLTIAALVTLMTIAMSLTVVGAGWLNPIETGVDDWTIPTSKDSHVTDALRSARDQIDFADSAGTYPVRSVEIPFATISFMYAWSDADDTREILTADNLRRMCEFQSIVTADSEFPKFCKPNVEPNGLDTECSNQDYDIVSLIYPSLEDQANCPELTEEQFEARLDVVRADPQRAAFFLERRINSTSDVRLKTRSQVAMFGPLGADSTPDGATFKEPAEDSFDGAQAEIYNNFYARIEDKIFSSQNIKATKFIGSGYNIGAFQLGDGLTVRFYAKYFELTEFHRAIAMDQVLVVFSIVLVGTAIWFHLHSLFITAVGLVAILASIPVALFVYTAICQIHYFTNVHIVIFFLILGIGADDLLVFVDAFIQSERYWCSIRGIRTKKQAEVVNVYGTGNADAEVLIARLVYTYKAAVAAIMSTSATTAGAFLATGISPIAPIASFGIYAALTVLMNFVWTMLLYPAMVVIHERYIKERRCGCARHCRKRGDSEQRESTSLSVDGLPDVGMDADFSFERSQEMDGSFGFVCNEAQQSSRAPSMAAQRAALRQIEREESAGMLPGPESLPHSFRAELSGIEEEDIGICDISPRESQIYDSEPYREVETSEESTKEMWEEKVFANAYVPFISFEVPVRICGREIKFLPVIFCTLVGIAALVGYMATRAIKLDTPTEPDQTFRIGHMQTGYLRDYYRLFQGGSDYASFEVVFGIEGLDRKGFKFLNPLGDRGEAVWDPTFDLASPTSQEYLLEICDSYAALSCTPEGAKTPLEGCVGSETNAVLSVDCTLRNFHEWHAANYPSETSALELGLENRELWVERLADFAINTSSETSVGIVDGEVRFLTFSYEASLKSGQPVAIKEPFFEHLETHLSSAREGAPAGLASMQQTGFDMLWIHTEIGIVTGMFEGLAISIPIAFLVLVASTLNLVLSAIAVLGIVSIVVAVLGSCQLLGWSLGVAEAMAAVMVVGLSVDYSTLHGTSYAYAARAGLQTRKERFRFSAIIIGPTVIAGALTTAGSAVPMFGAQLEFFFKMAILLTGTIAYSLLVTEFMVMPLFRVIGPEGSFADVSVMARALRMRCGPQSEVDDLEKDEKNYPEEGNPASSVSSSST
ncbi:Protein dispatched-like 1 [Hondaea fermentalgiana]|uniref:Protein dispatched-like 1 n=1 Tax=Hondaea fermentalgiana TaxID=2315210 RepID=A0A2R5GX13_9STRA|nr:Protein dispatched-like 1 [Hondaea fermentalgiana]|eukprot:GBG34318.1 Protein dispatched-like 1 [Hondaea fermentalgiana]